MEKAQVYFAFPRLSQRTTTFRPLPHFAYYNLSRVHGLVRVMVAMVAGTDRSRLKLERTDRSGICTSISTGMFTGRRSQATMDRWSTANGSILKTPRVEANATLLPSGDQTGNPLNEGSKVSSDSVS